MGKKSIDDYARKQATIRRIRENLKSLIKERSELLTKITRIDRQIEKHEEFLEELEE